MKLQKIIERLQKLHPKEIDLSLDRVKNLCEKLGNPQDNLKYISVDVVSDWTEAHGFCSGIGCSSLRIHPLLYLLHQQT